MVINQSDFKKKCEFALPCTCTVTPGIPAPSLEPVTLPLMVLVWALAKFAPTKNKNASKIVIFS